MLRLEPLKRRGHDLARQDDGKIDEGEIRIGKIKVHRDARAFDLGLAGEEEEARHDEAKEEADQYIREDDGADAHELLDARADEGARASRSRRCNLGHGPPVSCAYSRSVPRRPSRA